MACSESRSMCTEADTEREVANRNSSRQGARQKAVVSTLWVRYAAIISDAITTLPVKNIACNEKSMKAWYTRLRTENNCKRPQETSGEEWKWYEYGLQAPGWIRHHGKMQVSRGSGCVYGRMGMHDVKKWANHRRLKPTRRRMQKNIKRKSTTGMNETLEGMNLNRTTKQMMENFSRTRTRARKKPQN